jgi:hypothetical protein
VTALPGALVVVAVDVVARVAASRPLAAAPGEPLAAARRGVAALVVPAPLQGGVPRAEAKLAPAKG